MFQSNARARKVVDLNQRLAQVCGYSPVAAGALNRARIEAAFAQARTPATFFDTRMAVVGQVAAAGKDREYALAMDSVVSTIGEIANRLDGWLEFDPMLTKMAGSGGQGLADINGLAEHCGSVLTELQALLAPSEAADQENAVLSLAVADTANTIQRIQQIIDEADSVHREMPVTRSEVTSSESVSH